MSTLRELTEDQLAIMALVTDGELNIEDVADHLDMLKGEKVNKIESCLFVLADMEAKVSVLDGEVGRLKSIQEQTKRAISSLRDYVTYYLEDGEKHEYDLFTVSRVKGRDIVQIINQDDLPEEWIKTKITKSPDKTGILKALKAGDEVPGCTVTKSSPSLRIK